MPEFVIAGLVLGGIHAAASAGLVITYTASDILTTSTPSRTGRF
jgi:branched-subunit amino acid ABC-type transport system permease component